MDILLDQSMILLLTPLVTALVEGAKQSGMSTNYAGPAAMVFAFALTALVADEPTSREAALTAIATGLAASGLYSQVAHYADEVKHRGTAD